MVRGIAEDGVLSVERFAELMGRERSASERPSSSPRSNGWKCLTSPHRLTLSGGFVFVSAAAPGHPVSDLEYHETGRASRIRLSMRRASRMRMRGSTECHLESLRCGLGGDRLLGGDIVEQIG